MARLLRSVRSVEIEAPVEEVFARWSRYEDLPRLAGSVRRVKCIDSQRVLWDLDVAGRQVVWEAEIIELVPMKLIRWESRWGAFHRGEVRFEPLPDDRSSLTVDVEFQPRGLLERLGARLGLVDAHIHRELDLFRSAVQRSRQDTDPARR